MCRAASAACAMSCRHTIEPPRARSCPATATDIGVNLIIRPVTTLRLIVLMLMAVLLPLRGTLAAVQPCLGSNSGSAVAVAQAAPADHHGGHGDAHEGMHGGAHQVDHHAGHHQQQTGDPVNAVPADPGSHGTGCQASACCLMPLATTPPATAALRLSNQLRFPALVTPEPAFQSGGQDRPPRRG